jgi:hypothetical protein
MASSKAVIVMCTFLTVSCVSPQGVAPSGIFSVVDDVPNKMFALEYRNNSNKAMCLSPSTWPNVNGNIPLTSADISVSINGKIFILDTFGEYCPDCHFRVAPKAALKAHLNYSDFKIPSKLVAIHKELHLSPKAVICS